MGDQQKTSSQLPSVKKNFIYRLLYELLIILTSFITTPYVSRVLQPDRIGTYSYAASIMTYFTLFAALGTLSHGEREISQHRDDKKESSKLFWEIELLTIFTTSVCIVIWLIVAYVNVEYRYIFLALLPLLFGTMFDISWYFIGHEQVKYIVIRNAICKLLGIVFLFTFIKDKDDLLLYVVANSVITMLGSLSMWTYLPKMLVKVDFKTLKIFRHFKETIIYFMPTVATSIYSVLDKTLIGIITKDSFENGYYEQATKIINLVKSIVFTSVNSVMGARISYLFAQEKFDEIRQRILKSMDFILLVGFGGVFGVIGVAKWFVPLFFGAGWEPVITLLYVMSPLIIIIGVSNCLGSQYYTPGGQRARSAKVIVLGSVVNLISNICLIPFFGGIGAAIGSIIAEFTISFFYVKMSAGYMTVKHLVSFSWKRIIAGVIMCVCVMLIGEYMHVAGAAKVVIQVFAGVGIYAVILVAMKDTMLFEFVKAILRKFKRK